MMMPVVEVLLFCSSFMQSQGGFSTARKRRREVSGATLPLLLQLLGSPEPKSESWTVLGAVYRKRRTMWEAGALLPAYAPPLLPAPQEGRHGKDRTGMSVVSQPHYVAAVIRHN